MLRSISPTDKWYRPGDARSAGPRCFDRSRDPWAGGAGSQRVHGLELSRQLRVAFQVGDEPKPKGGTFDPRGLEGGPDRGKDGPAQGIGGPHRPRPLDQDLDPIVLDHLIPRLPREALDC